MTWFPATPASVLLGLDAGSVRCGFATAHAEDAGPRIATPLAVIATAPVATLAQRLREVLGERRPTVLIAGLPLDQRGQEGPAAQAARALAERLAAELAGKTGPADEPLPLYFVDERFSTAAVLSARRDLHSQTDERQKARPRGAKTGQPSARELRTDVDASVAAQLLQSWLDRSQ